MANHVHPDNLQNTALFGGDAPDAFNYFNQGQSAYSSNLLPDQQPHNPQLNGTPSHSPYNPTSAFSPPPTAWQNAPTASSIPNTQANQYLTTNRGYYQPQSSNTSNNYFQGHQLQYGQNVDPSLLRQAENRPYGQNMGLPATTSQSTSTISPASLHQQQSVSRPVAPASNTMQHVFSMQTMAPQPREAARPAAVNGGASVTQVPKAPKGTQSGNFIIVSFDDMAKATQSKKLANFVNISAAPVDLNLTKVNIPQYVPRKSQNELRALAASDPSLKAKIMKRAKKTKLHIQKLPRPTTPLNKGSPVSLSSSSDSSDTDSSSDSESDASPPPEKSPLPATRPLKAVEAVRYDTIKAVWFPRNKFAENERILKGLADLWEVIRTIRDRWKSDRDAVKKAVEAKQESELPLLRERVDKQIEMMEAVLKAAAEFGHPDLLSACGQNQALMSTCYSFILEPVRDGKYTGTFIKAVFRFLSLCTNLGSEVSEKTGLSKLFTRSIKRGSEDVKAMTAKINENIAATDKRTKAARGLDKSAKSTSSPKPAKQDPETVAGVKRPRPGDSTAGQPAKRIASGAPAATGSKESTAAKLGLVKKAGTANAAAPATAAKTKIVKPPAGTTSFFGLQSASKKPGAVSATPTAKKVGAGVTTEKKAAAPAAPVAAARPAFSFAETMANLSKEKEAETKPAKKKEDENRPPETEEEKKKRLRKEERRALRVRWKPDFDLVQVRTFSPDPSEMSGKARNVRDVGNGKEKEGFTLKKHMDMMDVDEEDDGQPMEENYFEFNDPSLIDFSNVPEDERARNFERFGGYMKVDSAERTVQDNHEANTLMVHYLAKSDIPPTPREPADPYSGPHVETIQFGYPDEGKWLLDRLIENPPPSQPTPATSQLDLSALLAKINPQLQQGAPAAPAGLPDLSGLQNILSSVPAAAPPSDPPQQQQAYAWTQQQAPASVPEQPATRSIEEILAALNGGAVPAAPAAAAPSPAMLQPPSTAAPTQAQPSTEVTALMAALMQGVQQNGTPTPASTDNPYAAYAAYAPPPNTDGQQDYSAYYSGGYGSTAASTAAGNAGDQGKRKWAGNASKKYTHPCRFWKEGKCKKGDSCTFRHD